MNGSRERWLKILPSFFEDAERLRTEFDDRFRSPRDVRPDRFVWDYWHVPDQYTYIRTSARSYFSRRLFQQFMARLRAWGEATLGCGVSTVPWLSYYVNGCAQHLHTDVPHGPWAYVYSLTRWDQRNFEGGETLLLRPNCLSYWQSFQPGGSLEYDAFIEKVPPFFNQLTVFDPRIPHGVREVEGSRDPQDSRVVLHGWFAMPKLTTEGGVRAESVRAALENARDELARMLSRSEDVLGTVIARVMLHPDGSVDRVDLLTDTLVSRRGDETRVASADEAIRAFLTSLRLPPPEGPASFVVPIRLPIGDEVTRP